MSRSVVLRATPRCVRCQLTPRWCVCAGLRAIDSPLRVDVLMHFMESYRPSSTGHLIKRVMPAAGLHLYRKEQPPVREDIVQPGRELWILHPQGEPPPAGADPAKLQVVLLDGTWVQATEMAHRVGPWGRRVSLPMTGESRYWLRTQAGPGRFSTVEALLFLLDALGLRETHDALRVQFELHVYASLRARGHKDKAALYLEGSRLRKALPEVLAQLTENTR
ncbi:MAG: DTW domain-containing protein [Opitutae bacterium]|nr:DTW domain-containing protein [Opitutae bacterium]